MARLGHADSHQICPLLRLDRPQAPTGPVKLAPIDADAAFVATYRQGLKKCLRRRPERDGRASWPLAGSRETGIMIEVTTGVFVPNRLRAIAMLVAATILASCASIAALAEGVGPLVIAKQGYFFRSEERRCRER